jgi:hypothetical protein
MKRFIGTYFVSVLAFSSHAQSKSPNLPIDSTTHLITYTEVVKVDSSLNKQKLFGKAIDWLDTAFRYTSGAIQIEDGKAGKIVARESMTINDGNYNYTIIIYVKDRRYKYVFTNFYSTPQFSVFQGGSQITDYGHCEQMIHPTKDEFERMARVAIVIRSYQKGLNEILSEMDKKIKDLIVSLKSSLNSVDQDTTVSDW